MPPPNAMRRRWVIGVAGVPALAAAVLVAYGALRHRPAASPLPAATPAEPPAALAQAVVQADRAPPEEDAPPPEPPSSLVGLDLARIASDADGAFAPTEHGVARP